MATRACWTHVRSCLASGSVSPKSAMSWRLPGRPSSISSTLRVPPSARVSTSCNTKPIHDPPAGNGPASHIAPPHTPNLWTLLHDCCVGMACHDLGVDVVPVEGAIAGERGHRPFYPVE